MSDPSLDRSQFDDEFSGIESLIAAAGNYVRPTEDLRPRVLEEVRTDRAERVAQERIWQLALALLFVGLLLSNLRSPASEFDGHVPAALSKPSDNPTWNTVEAMSELRRRQATMLRLAM